MTKIYFGAGQTWAEQTWTKGLVRMGAVAPSRGRQTYNAATSDTRGRKGTDESMMGPHWTNVGLFGSKGDHDATTWVQKGQIGQNQAKSSKIGPNRAKSAT